MSFAQTTSENSTKVRAAHVQHHFFSSFNESEHCFLALSLPFPSSLA